MKYTSHVKVSNQLLKMEPNIVNSFLRTLLLEQFKKLRSKGKKVVGNVQLKFCGNDADNFIRDITNVLAKYNVYKKPRFIK